MATTGRFGDGFVVVTTGGTGPVPCGWVFAGREIHQRPTAPSSSRMARDRAAFVFHPGKLTLQA